jgi:hypothetical protein
MKKLFGCNCNCKEELRELRNRIDFLAHQTKYHTDDYWHFMNEPPTAPLKEVVRRIANHLGMQIITKPAQEQSYMVEFKKASEK